MPHRVVIRAARVWMRRRGLRAADLRRRVTALGAATILVSFLIVPALGAAAPEAVPVTLTADHIQYDTQTGDVVADGHVKATQADQTITADHLTGNLQTGQVHAEGHVTLTQTGRVATGDAITYNYRTRVGQMGNVTSTYGPWNMTGRSLETSQGQGVGYNTSMTPCNPKHPAFLVKSKRVVVVPDDRLTAYQSTLYVYGVPVAYLPVYTASLRRQRPAQSGPTVGYNNFDGLFIEYNQWFPVGDASDQLRVRYSASSPTQFTAENTLSQRFSDHVWTLHLGRQEFYDQNGNLANVDRNSLDAVWDAHNLLGLPAWYQVEAHYGDYNEIGTTWVHTTRADGLLTVGSDTFQLATGLTGAVSAYYRYDSYGTGQERDILSVQAAVSRTLNTVSSATLSYNLVSIAGVNPPQFITNGGPFSPFSFDSLTPASTATLTYSYYPANGLFNSGSFNFQYGFDSQQLASTMSVTLQVSPTILFTAAATYNYSTSQVTEVDYAVNGTCDCLQFGVLYRTFPNPSSNTWYITLGINTLPGAATQFQLGGGGPNQTIP